MEQKQPPFFVTEAPVFSHEGIELALVLQSKNSKTRVAVILDFGIECKLSEMFTLREILKKLLADAEEIITKENKPKIEIKID